MKNGGTLARAEPAQFAGLPDTELAAIEIAVHAVSASGPEAEIPEAGS